MFYVLCSTSSMFYVHRRYPDSGINVHYLSSEHHGSPSPPDKSALHHLLGEVQPHNIDRLPIPRFPVVVVVVVVARRDIPVVYMAI
jgi:hypothetical protein